MNNIDEFLEKCPFCGSEAEIDLYPLGDNRTMHVIKCSNCGASMECVDKRLLIDRWNCRIDDSANINVDVRPSVRTR